MVYGLDPSKGVVNTEITDYVKQKEEQCIAGSISEVKEKRRKATAQGRVGGGVRKAALREGSYGVRTRCGIMSRCPVLRRRCAL